MCNAFTCCSSLICNIARRNELNVVWLQGGIKAEFNESSSRSHRHQLQLEISLIYFAQNERKKNFNYLFNCKRIKVSISTFEFDSKRL